MEEEAFVMVKFVSALTGLKGGAGDAQGPDICHTWFWVCLGQSLSMRVTLESVD